jgi:UDP-glucose 4-epimerase
VDVAAPGRAPRDDADSAAPRWRDLVGDEQADAYAASGTIPAMLDEQGRPVKRNFVHVDDLADAILNVIDNPAARRQTFNICMDEPVD